MLLDLDDSQLVLVDYQIKLMPHIFEGKQIIANAVRLGKVAKRLGVPVWGTEQNPEGLGHNMPEIAALCAKTLAKDSFDACVDGLLEALTPKPEPKHEPKGNARSLPKHLQKAVPQSAERNTIVLAGCESHVCLLQTALGLLEQDLDVWVVTDASSSRTERSRDAAFDRLAGEGVQLVSTEMVAFEWLRGSDHPAFRDVLALLK